MKHILKLLKYVWLFSVIVISVPLCSQTPGSKGNLKVVVLKIRNSKGQVGFFLYKSSEGFPNHFDKSILSSYVKTNASSTLYTFHDVEFGTYAVCVFHDENSNKKIDSNWIGMPKEGIGVSNNAKGHFGAPKYEDAKFTLDKPEQTITIALTYL